MAKSKLFRTLSLFLVFLTLQTTAVNLYAQDDAHIAGRVFDADKNVLTEVKVTIVQTETGLSRDTETNKNGCYDFDKVVPGTYTLTVNQKQQNYTLPDKIRIEDDVKVLACVQLAPQNILTLLTDNCKCKEFPWIFIILGTAAGAGLLLVGEENNEEASPSRP